MNHLHAKYIVFQRSAETEREKVQGRQRYWLEQWVDAQLAKSHTPGTLERNWSANSRYLQRQYQTELSDPQAYIPKRSGHQRKQRSIGNDNSFPGSPAIPAYMASTESAKAKARSLSSPRLRPLSIDICSETMSPYKHKCSPISSINSEMTSSSWVGNHLNTSQKSLCLKGPSCPYYTSLFRFQKTLHPITMAAYSLTAVHNPLHSLTQIFKTKTLTKPQKKNSKPATTTITTSKLRAAVIGGGPAGSSAAEALASGNIETYIFERSPEAAKPCGGAIPLCMLDEFSIPTHLIDRKVTQMKIISPSNLTVDFGKTLKPHEFISMVRREVLDDFLRGRAEECGAILVKALVKNVEIPISEKSPYIIHYISNNTHRSQPVDVVIGADGANSKVAKSIKAGNYTCAIAFQERIKLPEEKMRYYENLAEIYVGNDVSPDFYGWVFPKCDHVAVGTGTIHSKQNIKHLQGAIRNRVRSKIDGGEVIKVEAHPIPEHPRPTRVRGRVALVGDSAGYVTKCSGEGIYFAAKSGRMCGEGIVRASKNGEKMIGEADLKREYLRRWDDEYFGTFKFLDVLQRVFYGSNAGREALAELCGKEYVQRMTFESYLYKRLAKGTPVEDLRMVVDTVGSLIRCSVLGREGRKRLGTLLEL